MRREQALLKVTNLAGGYSKDLNQIHDLNFSIYPGEIVGLIGLNGAGKSTTMKMILGLLQPRTGSVHIGRFDINEEGPDAKKLLGYIPEIPLLYDELTLADHLRFTAMAFRMKEDELEERMGPLLEAFRMEKHLHEFPTTFSKGMRQKVMIMCALLHQPQLFLVDEPFIGLDPKAYRELTNLLIDARNNGAGVLVTTHVLDSAERFCDRFIIIHHGRIVSEGTLEELRMSARKIIELDNNDSGDELTLLEVFETILEGENSR